MSEQTPETKVCPDCAETVRAQARVCRFCGYRFDAAPAPVQASVVDTVFSRPVDRRGWFLRWGMASAFLVVLGALGPWVRIGPYGPGTGAIERGRGALLVLAAAVVGGVLLVVWRRQRAAGIAALLAGLLGLAVAHHDRTHLIGFLPVIHATIPFFDPRYVHVGWGLNLALVGSLSLALCGLVWLIAPADPSETLSRLEPMPPLR